MHRIGPRCLSGRPSTVVAAALALAAVAAAEPAVASFPGRNGRIAFTTSSTRPGMPAEPYADVTTITLDTVRPDGTGKVALTSCTMGTRRDNFEFVALPGQCDHSPVGAAYSASGRRLVFGDGSLALADARGRVVRDLPQRSTGGDGSGFWSPDGTALVFIGITPPPPNADYRAEGTADLFITDASGASVRPLTRRGGVEADWSSKGRIAFVRDGGATGFTSHTPDIYTVRPDGTRLRRLTKGGDSGAPSWSPHATKLAFVRNFDVYVMRADGGGVRRLTRLSGVVKKAQRPKRDVGAVAWSPDGRFIAFQLHEPKRSGRNPPYIDSLYTMRSDGTHLRRLDVGEVALTRGAWQPLP